MYYRQLLLPSSTCTETAEWCASFETLGILAGSSSPLGPTVVPNARLCEFCAARKEMAFQEDIFSHFISKWQNFRRTGVEPVTYGWRRTTTVHRSTNWAIDGRLNLDTSLLHNTNVTGFHHLCAWATARNSITLRCRISISLSRVQLWSKPQSKLAWLRM